jgi:hypothetical protein
MAEGYGVSVWCLDSLQTGRYVSGVRAVAQSIYRRLTTPRGTLRGGAEESTFGLDLPGLVGSATTPADLAALPVRIQAELLKDDRIARVVATVTDETLGPGETTLTVGLAVTLNDSQGSFTLTLAVDDMTVEILGALPS